jgi:hypothetical protein
MNPATWLVSRELTDAAGPWDTRLVGGGIDDGEYFGRVILANNGIRFVRDVKVFYRLAGPGSLSQIGRSNKKMESLLLGMELQIGYLRSLDDSKRSRAACVNYLQTWLPTFYPERPDLVQKAQQLATNLGSPLSLPKASWKYAWIEKLLGFAAAKHMRVYYNRGKSCVLRVWDKMMYSLERNSSLPT